MFSSFTPEVINMIGKGVLETLYMTLVSTICGYIIGLPWGVALSVTDKSGLRPNRAVYQVLSFIANVMRSIPFLILLILVMPFTLFLIGRTYGSTATIVPLTLSASPLIARMVETSLQDVDRADDQEEHGHRPPRQLPKRNAHERDRKEHPLVRRDASVVLDAERPLGDVADGNRQERERGADRNLKPQRQQGRRVGEGDARQRTERAGREGNEEPDAASRRQEYAEAPHAFASSGGGLTAASFAANALTPS